MNRVITASAGISALKGKVDQTVEKIMIEPHVLHVSAEAITPELLKREEKLLEKQEQLERRRKEKQERMGKKLDNINSATSSRSSSIDDNVDDSDIRTSSASTSRSATPTLKNGLSFRNRNADGKDRLNKRKGVHLLSSNEAKKPRLNNALKPSLKPEVTLQKLPIQDTVLIKLSSGQIVRVPKVLLKRVSLASGKNSLNNDKAQLQPSSVIPVSMISSEHSTNNQSKLKENSVKDPTLSISNPRSSDVYKPVSTPFVCRLSDALEKISSQQANCDENKNDLNQNPVLNGILEKLTNVAGNGSLRSVKTVKIRAYQGKKNDNTTSQSTPKELGIAKLSQQLKKVEEKLALNLPKAVPIPNIGVSKGTTQQQTIMMSGGGNVTRVVIPKWLNVTVAPPSGSHTNVVAVSPTKQTQNIIRIRGPIPARTHTQQNSTLNPGSQKNVIAAGSSLLLKDDLRSSPLTSNLLQKVSVANNSPLKLITSGATRTIFADLNGVIKQQQNNPQQLRVIHHPQQPFILNNVANNSTVVNTLFKDTSGSPIVIKKSLVSSNSLGPSTGPTLLNVTNKKSNVASGSPKTGSFSDIGKLSLPNNRNNVVIVENINAGSKETANSFYKSPIVSQRQMSAQSKSSVPAVVMVSKVDHNAAPAKVDVGSSATSVISSSQPVQGEVEFYDKEL